MEEKIKKVIETKIRPSLQMDGGDIEYVGYEEGIVKVKLTGACHGCPHAAMTLQSGVEIILKDELPEIKGVQNVG
jgi:Fe-S cluster biogenesis protein NfuA